MPVRASQLRSVIALTPFCVFTFCNANFVLKNESEFKLHCALPPPPFGMPPKRATNNRNESHWIEAETNWSEPNRIELKLKLNRCELLLFLVVPPPTLDFASNWGIDTDWTLNNVQWVHQFCDFNVNSGWVIEDWLTNSKNNKSKKQQQQQQEQNESNKMVMTTF